MPLTLAISPTPPPLESVIPTLRNPYQRRRRVDETPFYPEQEESILRTLGRGSLGAIAGVGNLLDVPGSFVRDIVSTLAGYPENPFDQLLPWNWFSSEGRTSDRELAERLGVVGRNKPGLDLGDVGAFVLGRVFDPLTYVTLGGSALTGAGRAVKAAGLMDDVTRVVGEGVGKRMARMLATPKAVINAPGLTSAEKVSRLQRFLQAGGTEAMLGERLGGVIGVGLPFKAPSFVLGTAESPIARALATGMDITGEAIASSAPVRYAKALFSPKMLGGVVSRAAQKLAPKLTRGIEEGTAEGLYDFARVIEDPDVARYFDFGSIRREMFPTLKGEDAIKAVNKVLNERALDAIRYAEGVVDDVRLPGDPVLAEKVRKALDIGRQLDRSENAFERSVGLDSNWLNDIFVDHWSRQRFRFPGAPKGAGGKGGRIFAMTHGFQKPRLDFMRDIPEGMAVLQEMSLDPRISGYAYRRAAGIDPIAELDDAAEAILKKPSRLGAPELPKEELDDLVRYVEEKYGPKLRKEVGIHGETVGLDDEKLRKLTHYMATLDPRHAVYEIPMFERNPFAVLQARIKYGRQAAETFKAAQRLMAETAVSADEAVPGASRSVLEGLQHMLRKQRPTEIPEQAKIAMIERLKETPRTRELVERIEQEVARDIEPLRRRAAVESVIQAEELASRLGNRTTKYAEDIGKTLQPLREQQALLRAHGALEQVEQAAREVAEGVKPIEQAVRDMVRVSEALRPIREVFAEKPAVARMVQSVQGILDGISNRLFGESAKEAVRMGVDPDAAVEIAKAMRTALQGDEAALSAALKNLVYQKGISDDAITTWLQAYDATVSGPIGLKAAEAMERVRKAIGRIAGKIRGTLRATQHDKSVLGSTENLEKLLGKATADAVKIAERGAAKFGADIPESMIDDIAGEASAALANARRALGSGDLEQIDLDAVENVLKETLGRIQSNVGENLVQVAKRSVPEPDIAGEVLSRIYVPQELLEDATRVVNKMITPEAVEGFRGLMKRFLAHWKSSVTLPWPAFHSRNLVSALTRNWLADAFDPKSLAQAWELYRGKVPSGLTEIPMFKGMTDKEAAQELKKLAMAYGLIDPAQGMHFTEETTRRIVGLPGDMPFFQGPPPWTTRLERMNPFRIETFAPYRIGGDIARGIEATVRLQPFINLLKKGWSVPEAARRVKMLQIDYAAKALADPVVEQVFPFFKFMRGVVPFVAEELTTRPGGKMAQMIRAIGQAHQAEPITPQYVAETSSIPVAGTPLEALIGKPPEGTTRYLTGAGLMFEDPLSFLSGPKSAGLELLSRMNPLIKAPLEYLTGQSFFQRGIAGGRPLEDLDPVIGRTIANIRDLASGGKTIYAEPVGGSRLLEAIASNAPITTRLATTARTLTDPRKSIPAKALQLLTGFRVTDVSEAAKDAMIQELIAEERKRLGGRTFTKTYIPESIRERMTHQQMMEAERLKLLEKLLYQRKKARKQQ